MRAFIVRPFGKKPVSKKDAATGKTEEILFDFDNVQEELIAPALKEVQISGGTTGEIFEPGDIREDMFSLLLLADIVIADITIYNANVFYELGIRHALRDKKTVLIKCPGYAETPFDILGYKYVDYEKDNPAKASPVLIQTLKDTIASNRIDSPVFNMLPKLQVQNLERFLAVPPDFGEEVDVARAGKQMGKLALMAYEVAGLPWEIPALRIIGEVQYQLKDFQNAKETWEKVRSDNFNDPEANDRLATIYQRLAENELTTNKPYSWELLEKSDQAIERLLGNYANLDNNKRAEMYSLRGRNAKERWVDSWKEAAESERSTKALQSKFLKEAYEDYERGYNEDLNHFYAGINALGLVTIIIALAQALPDIWELEYDSQEEAEFELKKYKDCQQKLATTVQVSIEAEKKRLQIQGKNDSWLNMTEADLACLISTKPARVGVLYSKVIQDANDLNFDAAKRQLEIYKQLGVLPENVAVALAAFGSSKVFDEPEKKHYLLFTGHMIDKPDRKEPRFPPNKEAAVRAAIKEAVQKEKDNTQGPITGIAGGACGGDILFHEVCEELGIPTELYLALPHDQFIAESVQFAGPEWVERFNRLYQKLPVKVLAQSKELPNWLYKKGDDSIWERTNLWMLYSALACGGMNMSLIALWDGKGGDAAGGTEHMVNEAKERGSKTIVIDINNL